MTPATAFVALVHLLILTSSVEAIRKILQVNDSPVNQSVLPANLIEETCLGVRMDVFIAVDFSTNVGAVVCRSELKLVETMVNSMDISPFSTSVAVLTYSDLGNGMSSRGTLYTNKQDLLTSISEQRLSCNSNSPYIDQAIRDICERGRSSSMKSKKVIVLVLYTRSARMELAAREAEFAKRKGFSIIVVGVGQQDFSRWKNVASSPSNLIKFTYSGQLETNGQLVAKRCCTLKQG